MPRSCDELLLRDECPADHEAIYELTQMAFARAEHRSGTEGAIVSALRLANALTVSLVAVAPNQKAAREDAGTQSAHDPVGAVQLAGDQSVGDQIIGHIAFSPVQIDGQQTGWFGLGPVSVLPEEQGVGTGTRLVQEGLRRLRQLGAKGCIVLGDPAFYERFGFMAIPELKYPGAPPEYFMAQTFESPTPAGIVTYDPAFEVTVP